MCIYGTILKAGCLTRHVLQKQKQKKQRKNMKKKSFAAEEEMCFTDDRRVEITVEPDIYFDEEPSPAPASVPSSGKIPDLHTFSNAVFFLECMEKLLSLVHSGKELKILRMRLQGMSYREIASSLHIGLASINRFIRRISLRNGEVGFLLENAHTLQKKDVSSF